MIIMWVVRNNDLFNLDVIDCIELDICEEDNQFELNFYRNNNVSFYMFFNNEKELKNAFLNIKMALKNNKKFLEL